MDRLSKKPNCMLILNTSRINEWQMVLKLYNTVIILNAKLHFISSNSLYQSDIYIPQKYSAYMLANKNNYISFHVFIEKNQHYMDVLIPIRLSHRSLQQLLNSFLPTSAKTTNFVHDVTFLDLNEL